MTVSRKEIFVIVRIGKTIKKVKKSIVLKNIKELGIHAYDEIIEIDKEHN